MVCQAFDGGAVEQVRGVVQQELDAVGGLGCRDDQIHAHREGIGLDLLAFQAADVEPVVFHVVVIEGHVEQGVASWRSLLAELFHYPVERHVLGGQGIQHGGAGVGEVVVETRVGVRFQTNGKHVDEHADHFPGLGQCASADRGTDHQVFGSVIARQNRTPCRQHHHGEGGLTGIGKFGQFRGSSGAEGPGDAARTGSAFCAGAVKRKHVCGGWIGQLGEQGVFRLREFFILLCDSNVVDVVGVLMGQWWQFRLVQLAEIACEDFCRGGVTDDVVEIEQQQARVLVLHDLHTEQGAGLEAERTDKPGQMFFDRFGGDLAVGETQRKVTLVDAGQSLPDLTVTCHEDGAQRFVAFHQLCQCRTQPVVV